MRKFFRKLRGKNGDEEGREWKFAQRGSYHGYADQPTGPRPASQGSPEAPAAATPSGGPASPTFPTAPAVGASAGCEAPTSTPSSGASSAPGPSATAPTFPTSMGSRVSTLMQPPTRSPSQAAPTPKPGPVAALSSNPAAQPPQRFPSSSTFPTAAASPPAPGTLSITTSVPPPLDRLAAIMAQPASSMPREEAKNLVHIEQRTICSVCSNFDPYKAPPDTDRNETHPSWARAEYQLPANLPVAKITVDDSKTLIEAADRGCLYCFAVRTSLGAVHPGWESEKSFLHIFLAPGLPVVVRLNFGVTSVVPLGREAMLGLGIELQEGQVMNFVITISEPSKPAVDVEIFRPIIENEQTTIGDIVLAPLVQHMGIGEDIPSHSGDPQCFRFIKDHVSDCLANHSCSRDGPLPLLPDRVLWVEANNATRIQLVEPRDIRAKYVAVSYCWGPTGPDTYLTDSSTYASRKMGIRFQDLPPLFRDVVSCARTLGIEYVWIDRLCIIQGDIEDFQAHTQGGKMSEIFGNATLTIAAASAGSEADHILVERDIKWAPFAIDVNVNGIGSLKLGVRRRTHPLGKEAGGGDYGKVSTRAWIWQERLLSARTVFFTQSALKFECRQHSVWEGFGPGVKGPSWSAQLDNISHLSWTSLVEEYMGRDITRQSDRLPAMAAVMKRIAERKGWSPLWGMWANALVESLGWQSESVDGGEDIACRMNPGHYAPTWSWASVDGPISYVTVKGMAGLELTDPMVYDLEVRSVNAASGLIRVAGYAFLVRLSCKVEYDRPASGDNQMAPKKPRYRYEILGVSSSGEAFPMHPDVHLKAWNGQLDPNGRQVSTVVRVPYGETPPETSWTSNCICLLVGKMKLRSLVIFLGGSLRVSGAWERLGMVSGLHPALFGNAQRMIFDIV
ncbi:hypothetical protein VTI74DRAFT_1103 [Chaetomium olivicolor]